jgi:hypothetical protein
MRAQPSRFAGAVVSRLFAPILKVASSSVLSALARAEGEIGVVVGPRRLREQIIDDIDPARRKHVDELVGLGELSSTPVHERHIKRRPTIGVQPVVGIGMNEPGPVVATERGLWGT